MFALNYYVSIPAIHAAAAIRKRTAAEVLGALEALGAAYDEHNNHYVVQSKGDRYSVPRRAVLRYRDEVDLIDACVTMRRSLHVPGWWEKARDPDHPSEGIVRPAPSINTDESGVHTLTYFISYRVDTTGHLGDSVPWEVRGPTADYVASLLEVLGLHEQDDGGFIGMRGNLVYAPPRRVQVSYRDLLELVDVCISGFIRFQTAPPWEEPLGGGRPFRTIDGRVLGRFPKVERQ